MRSGLAAMAAALALSACATSGGEDAAPSGPPSLIVAPGQPAPA